MTENFWYSYDKIRGYNATWNFIVSERGCGKTYGALKMVVKDFLKTRSQFIYLRRYRTELNKSVPRLFDAFVVNNEFPEFNFFVKGNKFYIKCKPEYEWANTDPDEWQKKYENNPKYKDPEELFDGEEHLIGEAHALSTANILKSTNFSQVSTIVFDEFMLATGTYHYLRNEVETFCDAYETIARLRDVKVYFLANNISITNPYYAYFDIFTPYNSEFKTFRNGLIVVNYAKNDKYREAKHKSKFGQLIENTHYANYAFDNASLSDNAFFLEKKNGNCRNISIIRIGGKNYGIWQSKLDNKMYVSLDYDPKNPCIFTFDSKEHDEHTMLIRSKKSWFGMVVRNYQIGNLYFETQAIKNVFLTILAKAL